MQYSIIEDVESYDKLFPIRLIGEISLFSHDLLNLNDEDNNYRLFDNNELIFRSQNLNKKQIYFCEYINNNMLINEIIPKKTIYSYEEPFLVDIMFNYTRQHTNNLFTTPSIVFTPLTVADVRRITLCIDLLIFVSENIPLGELSNIFINSLNKQIDDFKKSFIYIDSCLSSYSKNIKLIVLHYYVYNRLITLIVPEIQTEIEVDWLFQVSQELNLERTLQRAQSLFPPKDVLHKLTGDGSKLVNPHLSIQTKFPESHLIKGRYTYYHYLQDNISDKGWGCAYRSLQTIVSWFLWNGFSTISVPSHRDIQLSLVKMRDKEQSFVGSHSWIGSFEINLVLQDLLGVESRIVSLTRGADLSSIYDQLADHFDRVGAPIMIGGGQLAHTIIGVSKDQQSRVRFLVLDPHFTGSPTDLPTILSKGWCGWKELSFWKGDLPYNLCLPTLPNLK